MANRRGDGGLHASQAAERRRELWDRREVIAAGAALGAAAGLATAMETAAAEPTPLHMAVADTRFPESRAFAAEAQRAGNRIAWITGDITDLWYKELDLLWREKKAPIAGLTAYGAFFCLERLAWDRGLRVTFRDERQRTGSGHPDTLYRWIIAPKPGHRIRGDAA